MASTLDRPSRPREPDVPRFVFDRVSWADYEAMLRIVGNRPVRVTYDGGRMELVSPSYAHENLSHLLGRMVDTLTEELNMPVEAGGTTTHKRLDLDRGAEPDQCYWLGERAARMTGKQELDLTVDPPPDLVVEVDVAHSALDRLPIFAALGVPEVWHVIRNRSLRFLHLQPDGTYEPRAQSVNFPGLALTDAQRFLEQGRTSDKNTWIRSFRTFVRDRLATAPRPPGDRGHP